MKTPSAPRWSSRPESTPTPSSSTPSSPPPTLTTTALTTALLFLATSPATAAAAAAAAAAGGGTQPSPQALPACDNVVADGHTYDLRPLAGPHAVVTYEYTRPTHHNTTYAVDLCGPLRRGEEEEEESREEERCPEGTRVCAIKHRWDPKENKVVGVDQVIPIVGGNEKDITWTAARLPKGDDKKEGLRVTLGGATTYQQRPQRAVVEFRCDADLAGTEGEWESIDKYLPPEGDKEKRAKRDEEKKKKDENKNKGDDSTPERQLKKDGAALVWDGYRRERDADGAEMDTLYLTWYTKHVCDAAVDQPASGGGSKRWGFFTWFYVIIFLGIAAYLIFGAWLNYNLHGARGWDLVPHSDMIRDLPYLMRDLVRSLLNTLQSSGSRGGYSAV